MIRKPLFILFSGLLLAGVAYLWLYTARVQSARTLQAAEHPELQWLRQEFGLADQEFARIRELHEGYLPQCARMCAKIAAVNAELESLVLRTNQVTPEIAAKLAEIGRLRQQCQEQMLDHFYAVSQSMPPEQGRRYLVRMQKLTSLSNMRDHSVTEHSQHVH